MSAYDEEDRESPYDDKFWISDGQDLSLDELQYHIDHLGSTKWLIHNVLPAGKSLLHGRPSAGKTFLVLDWSYCIATGQKWLDRYEAVMQPVLYLLGEGQGHSQLRRLAWLKEHDLKSVDNADFIMERVPFSDHAAVKKLIERIDEWSARYGLVVIDTLAAHFGGGSENSDQDMKRFTDGVDMLMEEAKFGSLSNALVVHHEPYTEERPRGSSVLPGWITASLHLKAMRSEDLAHVPLRLKMDKPPRDARPFGDLGVDHLNLFRDEIELGWTKNGQRVTSCVIRPGNAEEGASQITESSTTRSLRGRRLTNADKLVQALQHTPEGLTETALRKASGIPPGSFHAAKQKAISEARVIEQNGRLVLADAHKKVA